MVKSKKQTIKEDVVTDIICNQCGCSLRRWEAGDPPLFCGLQGCCLEGEYFSPVLPDGVSYRFDLCEQCAMQLIKGFKIPADKEDRLSYLTMLNE